MQETEYEPKAEDLGNCPNCAAVVVRELRFIRNVPTYFWPCVECGYTHYGPECPALE